jgi:glutathione S-transferase
MIERERRDMGDRLILHEDPISGNCYKIRLTAALLGIPIERRAYDVRRAETRTPEFLSAINANGRIPVLQIGARFLPESAAACLYLAQSSPLIPWDRFDHADMMRWLFFEQYNHEPNVATLRFWRAYVGEDALSDLQRALVPVKRREGAAALRLMDDHLATHGWFAGGMVTLADIALYAYTHVAEEGGFALADYPHVRRWLRDVECLPRYVPMRA